MLDVRPLDQTRDADARVAWPAAVDPDATLADQMLEAARAGGETMPTPVADFAIDAFDAESLLDRVPRPMSRGELQLCALLIALAGPFDRLDLVDPTAGLDARRRRAVVELLADLAADHHIVVESDDPLFDRFRG